MREGEILLYLIIKKEDIDTLEYILETTVIEEVVTEEVLNHLYTMVVLRGDTENIQDVLIQHSIKALAVLPYLSKESFISILSEKVYNNLNVNPKFKETSLFEIVMCKHKNIYPNFNTDYILLTEILPVDKRKYIKDVNHLNYVLDDYNLLLDEDKVKVSFGALFKNAIYKVLETEANNEEIRIIDIKKSNKNFRQNTIAEFLLTASAVYPKDEIRDFLEENFQEEMDEN